MQLIIGLGNPGKEYEHTRHNMGFLVLDAYARESRVQNFAHEQKFASDCARIGDLRLMKPLTFMNESGTAVQKYIAYYHIDPTHLLVIHDELDLPFGEMKLQFDRGAAGHNGVASIHQQIGTSGFWRLRIGIKPQDTAHMDPEKFVVSKFTPDETKQLSRIISKAVAAIRMIQSEGTEKTIRFLHSETPAKGGNAE